MIRDPKTQFPSVLMADDTIVDLPVPVNEIWKITQANAITSDDSHAGAFAYCYDMVRQDNQQINVNIPAAATGRLVYIEENLPSGKTNSGNVVVQALGRGRYASYLHLAKGSYRETFGKNKVVLPGNPWPDRPIAPAGAVIGKMGDTGTGINNHHLHFCVTTAPDRQAFSPFESVPVAFRNFQVSGDGKLWTSIAVGTPVAGLLVRHASFSGPAKIGINNALSSGSVSGTINLSGTPKLPAGGKIVIDVISYWGEPIMTIDQPIFGNNLTGPWAYSFGGVPVGNNMKLSARYIGPPIPGISAVRGTSSLGAVPPGGVKDKWLIQMIAEKPNQPYIG
jgi:hypothetical protein